MSELTLADLDRDEALSEALGTLYGSTRAEFLRRAAFGGAAMLGALLVRPTAAAAAVSDIEILNFGLRFEYLQATFYTQAEQLGTIDRMTPRKQEWARVLGAHERAHVKIIKSVLGTKAAPQAVLRLPRRHGDRRRLHAHRRGDGGPDRGAARRRDAARSATAASPRRCSAC